VPGVDIVNYEICFRDFADLREVVGVSDNVPASEFARQQGAFANASEFNRRVARGLQRRGHSNCDDGVDWNRSFGEIAREFSPESVSDIAIDTSSKVPTLVVLRESPNRNADAARLCGMARARGLEPVAVKFRLYPSSDRLTTRSWDCAVPPVPKPGVR